MDADRLAAGRDINLNQHVYYGAQAPSTPSKSIQEGASVLLTKLHSRSVPLSQCLAEGLSLAVRAGDRSFEAFCRRELEGWTVRGSGKIETGDKNPDYRAMEAYLSPIPLDMRYFGNPDAAIRFMKNNDNFQTIPLFEPMPIAEIEREIEKNEGQELMSISQVRVGDFLENATNPNAIFYAYFSIREFEKILRAVRKELNSHLLELVTGDFQQKSQAIAESMIETLQATGQVREGMVAKKAELVELLLYGDGPSVADKAIRLQQRANRFPQTLPFGLGLKVTAPAFAIGISIRLSFYWEGDAPTYSPRFSGPIDWVVKHDRITNDEPAILTYETQNFLVNSGAWIAWQGFNVILPELMRGRFRVEYTGSTTLSPVEYKGTLFIALA